MFIPDTYDFLLGSWRIERELLDLRDGVRGLFVGVAHSADFTSHSETGTTREARYEEEGELQIGDFVGESRRSLTFVKSGATVNVCFSDGRSFIDLDLRDGTWRSTHLCGEDTYEIDTCVLSEGTIEERWHVNGPSKRYSALTTFNRA